jgi:zinc protease
VTRTHGCVFALAIALGALGLAAAAAVPAAAQEPARKPAFEVVTLPSPASPLVSVRLMFDAGSIHDPEGKEGLAALTALMVGQGGTRKRSYSDMLDTLYPMAATVVPDIDREVTLFYGTVHRDELEGYTALLEEALLQPAFAESDFTRNKEELLAYLTNTLRSGSDELLGLEAIQQAVFAGHPYEHSPAGTVEGLKSITLEDVRRFYQEQYTQANLMLGIAGGYPEGYVERLRRSLSALPAGTPGRAPLPPPPAIAGRRFQLLEKETGSVGIHLGYPLPVTRADADYYPLLVVNSYLGEHRTSHGRLMQKLREERGLNYGDYSYIEFWPNPPTTDYPGPGAPRRHQFFSVWLRPVAPADAQFALRGALHEIQRLREEGMTREEFELTREFLIHYSKLWAQSLSDRLGVLMDSKLYGTPYFIDEIDTRLRKLTLDDVNRVLRKYLRTDDYVVVMVTGNARQLADTLRKDEPSPKTYNAEVAPAILEVDKQFVGLKVQPTDVRIVPVAEVFQK